MLFLSLVLLLIIVFWAAPPVAQTDHPAPTGLTVIGKTDTTVSLDWNRSAGAVSYRVRKYNASGVNFDNDDVSGATNTQYTVTGLSPSTGYQFDVRARDATTEFQHYSAATPKVSATTNSGPVPPRPSPQCSDGVNNDGAEDTLIDYPADPGCISATDNSESPNSTTPPTPANPQPEGITWNGRSLSAWVQQECPPYTTVDQLSDSTGSFIRTRVNASGESCWGPSGPPGSSTGSRWRAQMIPRENPYTRPLPRGVWRYVDFGFRIPARFPVHDESFCNVASFAAGSLALSCSANPGLGLGGDRLKLDNHPDCSSWTAPFARGQGWHRMVAKMYLAAGDANGRFTLWHKPPGASSYTKVINDCRTETWNNTFANVEVRGGTHPVQEYYHGGKDYTSSTTGIDPWIDHIGMIWSTGHQID